MYNDDFKEALNILISMQREFSTEEESLMEISKSHTVRIEELEDQINTYRKNEDIDFRVFSPRNVSLDNSDKVSALESEKASLIKEKRDADKQLGYYSEKATKLNIVIGLIKNQVIDSNDNIDDGINHDLSKEDIDEFDRTFRPRKKFNPFAFLEEEDDSTENDLLVDTEESINDSNDVDNIDELFSKDDFIDKDNDKSMDSSLKISIDDLQRICHKVEFTEKIINNDRVRAKFELKNIVTELKDFIKTYK